MKYLDKDLMLELTQHPGYPLFIKLLNDLVELTEDNVLKEPLTKDNVQELVINKARAEGARRLFSALQREIVKLKPTQ